LSPVRFRFADFVVSPARRQVLRGGEEVPLIPRYFDLLVLLLQRRGRAVHRREIFDTVWNDVVVSDGALSQAVRTLRRALGDDSHDPAFIRTVSRHGYRFDAEVTEEPDPDVVGSTAAEMAPAAAGPATARWRIAVARWASGVAGGATAGALAGALGGVLLVVSPGSVAPANVPVVLALVGALVGGLGAAGVAAGLAAAEALAPRRRVASLTAAAAVGGGTIGFLAHHLARWTLQGLFGRDFGSVGGGWEGVALGTAAGLAYALMTSPGAASDPRRRLRVALAGAAACGLAGLAATAAGANLTGVSLNTVARAFQGSQVQLAPVARLVGEAELGPLTRGVLGGYEGACFGFGLLLGFTRRARWDRVEPGG
jgi:transcriptional regulator HilA, main transcriptional regulator of SPI1